MFIKKANEIHNNKYDYSKVNYITGHKKIIIICKDHGEFEQLPCNHLAGQNCPICSNRHKITDELFIEKANKIHNNKYDYSEINYKNSHTLINIKCKDHGIFSQMPLNHLKGNGCYKCSNIVKNTEDFIKKSNIIHKNIYDYSKTDYISTRNKVIIICKIHGEFKQSPNDHLNDCGCPRCSIGNFSKSSIKWLNDIMIKENIFIQHADNNGEKIVILNNRKIKFDGYCEATNTVFEYFGDFFHGNPSIYNFTDINPLNKKTYGELYEETLKRVELIKNNNYNLITMWESDFNKNLKK